MCHLFYLLLPCVSRQHHGRTWWQWRWKVCKLRHMSMMSFVFLLSRWNDASQLCPCFTCCFIGGWLLGSLELDNGFMTVWQAEPPEQAHGNLGGRNYIELTRRIQFLYSQSMWQHVPHSSPSGRSISGANPCGFPPSMRKHDLKAAGRTWMNATWRAAADMSWKSSTF